jgi:hypothetical protein
MLELLKPWALAGVCRACLRRADRGASAESGGSLARGTSQPRSLAAPPLPPPPPPSSLSSASSPQPTCRASTTPCDLCPRTGPWFGLSLAWSISRQITLSAATSSSLPLSPSPNQSSSPELSLSPSPATSADHATSAASNSTLDSFPSLSLAGWTRRVCPHGLRFRV